MITVLWFFAGVLASFTVIFATWTRGDGEC